MTQHIRIAALNGGSGASTVTAGLAHVAADRGLYTAVCMDASEDIRGLLPSNPSNIDLIEYGAVFDASDYDLVLWDVESIEEMPLAPTVWTTSLTYLGLRAVMKVEPRPGDVFLALVYPESALDNADTLGIVEHPGTTAIKNYWSPSVSRSADAGMLGFRLPPPFKSLVVDVLDRLYKEG